MLPEMPWWRWCQALESSRDAEAHWEALAQDGLAQSERLKDLLEESALWRIPTGALRHSHSGRLSTENYMQRGASPGWHAW